VDGRQFTTLQGKGIVPEFISILDDYVARRFGGAKAG
jgi:(E)-4-hydroxy-3-methylbut-2-enyl-diphosphate synthase